MTVATTIFVHAHPDDEALFTGGRQALGFARGERQVLITCTDGSLGFDPEGRSPLETDHDRTATALARSAELRQAAELLGCDRLVELAYPDSGMAGWPTCDSPTAFVNQPVDDVAWRLSAIFDAEGPCAVVTYAADGFYGHPDHVATHRAVMRAAELSSAVMSVEAVIMTAETIDAALSAAARSAEVLPAWLGDRLVAAHDGSEVTRLVDAALLAGTKQAAIAAHASQLDNAVIAQMDPEVFSEVFGVEQYARLAC